jgi:hypothetical protein
VLDEHLQARARLVDLARGLLEHRGRDAQPSYEDDAGGDDNAENDHRDAQPNRRRRAGCGADEADDGEPCQKKGAAEQTDDG